MSIPLVCSIFVCMKKIFKEFKLLNRSIPGLLYALLIISIVLMNLLANKSIDFNSNFIALDCGIIFSWITFLVMDLVVKRFGLKAANYLTISSLIINLFVSLLLVIVSYINGMWSASYVEHGDAINNALNLTIRNTWYILLGSSIAFLVSSLVNNVLNHFIGKKLDQNNTFWGFIGRSFISTFIGQFVDNLLFALIVSLNFFGWNIVQCIMCALTGALLELLVETIFFPIAYKIVKKWEKDNVGKEYIEYMEKKNEAINNGN